MKRNRVMRMTMARHHLRGPQWLAQQAFYQAALFNPWRPSWLPNRAHAALRRGEKEWT